MTAPGSRSFAAEGIVSDRFGFRDGWIIAENGVVYDTGYGSCPMEPDVRGFILRDTLNMHTHCADYGLEIPPGMSLSDLVAPPDGLKHRYLRETPASVIENNMARFGEDSRRNGSTSFVDFREGGAEGCKMLRGSVPNAIILGRPISQEFNLEEIESILDVADGIGIPSISDMDYGYIDKIADAVREKHGIFAIHASERIREDIDLILSLDPAFVVHMCEASDSDIVKCAEAEVPIVLCPTSNAYFGKTTPAARALSLGADIALGTDNGMLCRPDMVSEALKLFDLIQAQGEDPDASLRALTRVSGKILNAVEPHQVATGPGPATILPSQNLDVGEALRSSGRRISLE